MEANSQQISNSKPLSTSTLNKIKALMMKPTGQQQNGYNTSPLIKVTDNGPPHGEMEALDISNGNGQDGASIIQHQQHQQQSYNQKSKTFSISMSPLIDSSSSTNSSGSQSPLNHHNLHNKSVSSFIKLYLPSASSPTSLSSSPRFNKRNSINRSASVFNLKNEMYESNDSSSSPLTSSGGMTRQRSQSEVLLPSWEKMDFEGDFTNVINDTLIRTTSNPTLMLQRSPTMDELEIYNQSKDIVNKVMKNTSNHSTTTTTTTTTTTSTNNIDSEKSTPTIDSTTPSPDLIMDSKNPDIIAAGKLEKIIGLLTDITNYTGTQYVEDILYTYHYFIKDTELLERLASRFENPLEGQCIESMSLKDQEQVINHVRFRVINVLKKWVEGHGYDFTNPILYKPFLQVLDKVLQFNSKWGNHLKKSVSNHVVKYISNQNLNNRESSKSMRELVPLTDVEAISTIMAKALNLKERKKKLKTIKQSFLGEEAVEWIKNRFEIERDEAKKTLLSMLKLDIIRHHSEKPQTQFKDKSTIYFFSNGGDGDGDYPQVIVPKQLLPSSTFLDVHPVEIARQMTLIDFSLYCKIIPSDLYHQAWNKPDANEKVPNLMAFIKRSNTVSYWVATEILLASNIKQRVTVLKRFITIAEILLKLNNWNTLMGIMLGLNLGSIQRLKRTWESLPKNMSDTFTELSNITSASQNYANYRKAISNPVFPCLPYFAVYLRDLTFIEDGNQDYIEDDFLNLAKMTMISKILTEIHRFQIVPYHLKPVESIEKLLKTSLVLSDKDLYKASNLCEQPTRTITMSTIGKMERRKSLFFKK